MNKIRHEKIETQKERWRKWIEDLRRRRYRQERDRRRRWLLTLLLALLESRPLQLLFPVLFVEAHPSEQKRQSRPSKKSEEMIATADAIIDERRHLYDYAPRRGEGHLEVFDGLTWSDILEYERTHRPWRFPAFTPIPGMPDRYKDAPVHIWTLLDHIGSEYHRKDAIVALKLIVNRDAHDWIDACTVTDQGWKDLRKCRRRTPEMTAYEFPRTAARWREDQRQEAEERKREAEKMLTTDPKPPGLD